MTSQLQAQSAIGVSIISITSTTVTTYSATELDYTASYYYDAKADGFLWQDSTIIRSGSDVGNPTAYGYMTASMVPGKLYEIQTNHWLVAAYVISGGDYYDPYGYSFAGGDAYGSEGDFPTGPSTYTTAQQYYLGSTYVTTNSYPPVISAVDYSDYGTQERGTTGYLAIYGTGLSTYWGPTSVSVDGSGVSASISYSDYTNPAQVNVQYTIASNASTGNHTLTISTLFGSATWTFTVYDPAATISSISPSTWQAGTASTFTISGSGFGSNASISINDSFVSLSGITRSDTSITGTYSVDANDSAGSSTITVGSSGLGGLSYQGNPGKGGGLASGSININPVALQIRSTVLTPPVASDGDAVVATQAFTLQAEIYNPVNNQRATGVSGTVNVSFESGPLGESIPSQITISNGVGTASVTLSAVNNQSQTRGYTLTWSTAAHTGAVNVWFSAIGTREGLVGSTTSCGHVITANDRFVALPGSVGCDKFVNVKTSAGKVVVPVLDIGPWYPHSTATTGNPCVGPADFYWNTTGIPRATTDTCSNGAGIDLADGTFFDLGLSNNGAVLWRFGN